jgi:signal transduction histidine kinase
VEVAADQIATDSLTNVARHASAAHVELAVDDESG